MTDPASVRILYPVFAMFVLVAIVLMRMRGLRFAAVRSGAVPIDFYRAFSDGVEPEPLRVVARHYANLFEMPVLFYVGAILTFVTGHVSGWMIGLAWAYVALRYAHSYVHLTSNHVMTRFALYFGSVLVLTLLWATLFVRLLRS